MTELLTKQVYRKTLASITVTIKADTTKDSLLAMVKQGVTIFRINFSWVKNGSESQWREKLKEIEDIAKTQGLVLGIMLDTKGPEFRVRNLGTDTISLADNYEKDPVYEPGKEGYIYKPHSQITLTLDQTQNTNGHCISVEAPLRTKFGRLGSKIVFGDGDYEAIINPDTNDDTSMVIIPSKHMCVWDGAKVNFPGTQVTARALGERDKEIIEFFIREGSTLDKRVNFMFAQSFIKTVQDMRDLIDFLDEKKVENPIIIAKLETVEASRDENLKEIIKLASGVMIARGDLANQTSREELPRIQRNIIKVAKEFNRSILLATHVYGSMKEFRRFKCARPEAEDVRSALELGVDGFVLTEETLTRLDPEEVVKALASQIEKDEWDLITTQNQTDETSHYERLREVERKAFHKSMWKTMRVPGVPKKDQSRLGTTDFAIAAVFRANQYNAIGLFPFTVNGRTVREMCRFYPETGIFPVTNNAKIAHSLLLCRCTHPVLVEMNDEDLSDIDKFKELVRKVVDVLDLRERNPGSRYAICTIPHPWTEPGGTDTLLRIRIEVN